MLKLVIAYDQADWDSVSLYSKELGIDETNVADVYVESLKWAAIIEKSSATK
jgi:c-di-GMP-related signal transduction protein